MSDVQDHDIMAKVEELLASPPHQLTFAAIVNRDQSPHINLARREVALLLRDGYGFTYDRLAVWLQRSRVGVMALVKRARVITERDAALKERLASIPTMLQAVMAETDKQRDTEGLPRLDGRARLDFKDAVIEILTRKAMSHE